MPGSILSSQLVNNSRIWTLYHLRAMMWKQRSKEDLTRVPWLAGIGSQVCFTKDLNHRSILPAPPPGEGQAGLSAWCRAQELRGNRTGERESIKRCFNLSFWFLTRRALWLWGKKGFTARIWVENLKISKMPPQRFQILRHLNSRTDSAILVPTPSVALGKYFPSLCVIAFSSAAWRFG